VIRAAGTPPALDDFDFATEAVYDANLMGHDGNPSTPPRYLVAHTVSVIQFRKMP